MPLRRYQELASHNFVLRPEDYRESGLVSSGVWMNIMQTQVSAPASTISSARPGHFTPRDNNPRHYYNTSHSLSMLTFGGPPSTAAPSLSGKNDIMIHNKEVDSFDALGEKGMYRDDEGWEGYTDEVLPEKSHPRLWRNLRHIVFSLYRRLFGLVFIVNMSVFSVVMARGGLSSPRIATIVTGNLFTAIVIRQDYVVNILFEIFCSVPQSWPLWFRRVCAKIYTMGGIHSGCAVSAVVWFIYLSEWSSCYLAGQLLMRSS